MNYKSEYEKWLNNPALNEEGRRELESIAGDEKAIGYASLGSVDDTVKALSVDGVAPTEETVADGSYKVSRPFELMYDETALAENDLLAEFIEYLKSSDAQDVIAEEGYVSVVEDATAYAAPAEALTVTEITATGSTSVGPLMTKLAEDFAENLRARFDADVTVQPVGPVIAAHCGPGTVGLIFHCTEK